MVELAGLEGRARRCLVLRGAATATAEVAAALVRPVASSSPGADGERVLWISAIAEEVLSGVRLARPAETKRLLGRAFDVVVVDLHDRDAPGAGIDPDVLGRCHGFVWGGGALVLRVPPSGVTPEAGRERLAVWPFTAADVGHRFRTRLLRVLDDAPGAEIVDVDALRSPDTLAPLRPAFHDVRGTPEQDAVVEELAASFLGEGPRTVALVADRGRGKSSALGLALERALTERSLTEPLRLAVTGPSLEAAAEVFKFAPAAAAAYRDPMALALLPPGEPALDLVVVDEAAQLPVPLLQQLAERHAEAVLAFATTVGGYEGTGRGFVLRFLDGLTAAGRPPRRLTLKAPIRFAEGDPLEALMHEALALDAAPASLSADSADKSAYDDDVSPARHRPTPAPVLEAVLLDRDALAGPRPTPGARLLDEVFGLLVHAHYRTTPSDLWRLLDAPNLAVHALLEDGRAVAATLVAKEGGLSPEQCQDLAYGKRPIRGHALADTLVCHSHRLQAGEMALRRSLRIAVHPERRRRGYARVLVEHVHGHSTPDLFGTLFGATPELLRFRREVGYELVRLGASRGARSGEPTAVMLRPTSPRAHELVAGLRQDLARDLPLQLALQRKGGELPLAPALEAAVCAGLPAPRPFHDDELRTAVMAYAHGARPFESAVAAVTELVRRRADRLTSLPPPLAAVVRVRVEGQRSWTEAAREAGLPTTAAAMRALREALRALVPEG